MNISFIGYGNMAKAIAHKLSQQGHYSIAASAPSLADAVTHEHIRTHYDNKVIIKDADIIILAVKPLLMSVVLDEIGSIIPQGTLLISVAAGLSLPWFAKHCEENLALIRTMPNTPAAVGLAVTPMIANDLVTSSQKEQAELIFSQIGITTWVEKEEDMDTFTALSGSGPAYVFLFIEAMIDAAVALGLDENIAKTGVLQTLKGALKLAETSTSSIEELRNNVTSPGGTTAAALNVLDGKIDKLMLEAIKAAKKRAKELGQSH